ncbi:hypothetical protein CQW23_12712 [Capsicum baccatum]|uniref:Ubiquitin-like protease family profile domain-containing protein n=1 Tax=Capsicum baccatum TaxID=33114 RepID=A0A2G2WTD7_CAPBA|nr:hypothetical protein CQW23_12712 [Capsicum baccatum]
MDDDTSTRDRPVHHMSGLYSETQKDATDKGEIGVSEFEHHQHGEVGVSPECHQHKLFVLIGGENFDQQQSQEDGSKKYESPYKEDMQHEDYAKGSLNDIEESRDEEFNKQHILEEQKLLDVNSAYKEVSRGDDLENEDYSDLKALEDEVGGTIINSIQVTVDSILFGFSMPSTTKSLDVGALNKMTESQWNLSDSQITLDFLDAQVQELEATKAQAPTKMERKKSRIFRSPYIIKYDSDSKDAGDSDKEENLKYDFDGYTINQDLPNELMIDYSQRIAVGLLKTHSDKYTMTSCFFNTYIDKKHTRYYPAELAVELSTQQDYAELIVVAKNEDAIANIIHEFYTPVRLPWCMVYEVYVPINYGKEFHWVLVVIVSKKRVISVYDSLSSKSKKKPPIEIQKLAVIFPTYLPDNYFYEKTERTNWPTLEAYKGKFAQQIGLVNEISFDVDYIQNIPQQASDSLDHGIFVCAYAEILSEGKQVHSCGFDAKIQLVVVGGNGWIGSCLRRLGHGAVVGAGDEERAELGGRPRFGRGGGTGGRVDSDGRLRVGSWNIGTLPGKSIELVKILRKRRINIAYVQETKCVGSKARDVDGYKLWYSGSERRKNEVGIFVDEELRGQVLEEALEEVVRGVPSSEKIVVAGGFNGHIGALPGGFGDVHGSFGFGDINEEGTTLLEFARSSRLVVVNSVFPKKEDLLITFRSAIARTQIDFLLLRKGDRVLCKDCKVIPSENLSTQHRILVMDLV